MRQNAPLLIWFLLATFAYLPSFSQPQDIRFKRISIREGLSQASVNAITQDGSGYLWFGTQDGLNRYDGYDIRVFTNNPGDSTTISDDYIWCLCPASDGGLWIGTLAGGLNKYNPHTGSFASFRRGSGNDGRLTSNNIVSIFEDADTTLWIGTWGGGLCRMDSPGGSFAHYRHDPANPTSLSNDCVACVLVDSGGDLWVATWGGGVCRLRKEERQSGKFTRYTHNAHSSRSIGGNAVWTIHEDRRGDLWFGTRDAGVSAYNRRTDDFTTYRHTGSKESISDNRIGCIHEDRHGQMWIGTWQQGLELFDRRRKTFFHYTPEEGNTESMPGSQVLSACEDNAGSMWFGTGAGGVAHHDLQREKFAHYRHRASDPQSLSSNSVSALWQDPNGDLWIGSSGGGLDFLPHQSKVFKHFRYVSSNPRSLSSNMVSCLSGRQSDALWIGTPDQGLNRYDRRTGTFRRFLHTPRNPSSIGDNRILALQETRNGDLWIGTVSTGLDRFDKASGTCVHYRHSGNDSTSLSGDWIWSLHEDRKGNLWVGTWGAGLNRLEQESGKFLRYRHTPGNPKSLGGNSVLCITEAPDGSLWVGTQGGGISRYDHATGTFTSFGERDGLASDVVYAILPDSHGFLWLSTNRGVSRFDPRATSFRNYDETDGLQSNEFNQGAYFLGRDGRMFMGGIAGFNVFHPDSIHDNTFLGPMAVTGFKVFERAIQIPHDGSAQPTVVLSPNQNFFSFEFASLCYTAPMKNEYAYKLEGLNDDWVQCGTRRYAAYTNLEGGDYIFRVKGSNNDGLWNEQAASVRIIVTLPYWKTLWFRIGIGALLIAIAYFFARLRISRLEKERATQQEFSRRLSQFQDSERKRIASALHDSLGQELLLVKNGLHLFASRNALTADMYNELKELADTVQLAIDDAREISFDLHPHTLDSLGLQKAILSVLRKLEHTSLTHFTTSFDPIDTLLPPSGDIVVFRLVQEALNNVVKHSQAANCSLTVTRSDTMLEFALHDDGIGFDVSARMAAATEKQGVGLISMAERVSFLKGDMTLQSNKGAGTTVTFRIPIPTNSQAEG